MLQKKKFYSKDQNKANFKNLDNFDVLSSDFEALETSAASAASLASATSTTLFTQRTSLVWWFDHIGKQNDLHWPLFVELIMHDTFLGAWTSFF